MTDPEVEVESYALGFSIRPLPDVPTLPAFPVGPVPTVAWALFLGEDILTFDWVMGDAKPPAIAKHLLRRWLEIRL